MSMSKYDSSSDEEDCSVYSPPAARTVLQVQPPLPPCTASGGGITIATGLEEGRPRSNPRTRTPMRHNNMSPLNPSFHRLALLNDNSTPHTRSTGPVPSIRIGAGRPVGTVSSAANLRNSRTNEQPSTYRSVKQGPSKRKTRRWNNDNFVGIASEIARYATPHNRNARMAEAFLRGEAEASQFVNPNEPLCYRSIFALMCAANDDNDDGSDKMTAVRERFVRGEICCYSCGETNNTIKQKNVSCIIDEHYMWTRIPSRLRNVVLRACRTHHGLRVLDAFETLLLVQQQTMSTDEHGSDDDWIVLDKHSIRGSSLKVTEAATVLNQIGVSLMPPSSPDTNPLPIVQGKEVFNKCDGYDGIEEELRATTNVCFHFDSKFSGGSFYRLLLHSVCQFHGLHSSSSLLTTMTGDRILTVRNGHNRASQFRLVDHVLHSLQATEEGVCVAHVQKIMTLQSKWKEEGLSLDLNLSALRV